MTARRAVFAVLLILLLPLASRAAAQEHPAAPAAQGSEAAAEHGGGGGSDMPGKIVNFVLLFGGLFLLLRKPLRSMLAGRTKAIEQSLAEARDARAEAEARLAEAKVRVAALEEELARIRSEAETQGGREKDRIHELARKEADRLRTLARQEVEAHLKASIRELKEYAAALAAGLAEERLRTRLGPSDQAALIDRSIDKLKAVHEESDPR